MEKLRTRYEVHRAAKQKRLAAEERRRVEEERKRVVEAQREAVRARAKKLGYQVQETREGERIRMVLVRRVY